MEDRRSRWLKSSSRLQSSGGSKVLEAMKTMVHMLLCGHSSTAGRCSLPNSMCDASSLVIGALQQWPRQVGAAALGYFNFGGAPRVSSVGFYGKSLGLAFIDCTWQMAITPLVKALSGELGLSPS